MGMSRSHRVSCAHSSTYLNIYVFIWFWHALEEHRGDWWTTTQQQQNGFKNVWHGFTQIDCRVNSNRIEKHFLFSVLNMLELIRWRWFDNKCGSTFGSVSSMFPNEQRERENSADKTMPKTCDSVYVRSQSKSCSLDSDVDRREEKKIWNKKSIGVSWVMTWCENEMPGEMQKRNNVRPKRIGRLFSVWCANVLMEFNRMRRNRKWFCFRCKWMDLKRIFNRFSMRSKSKAIFMDLFRRHSVIYALSSQADAPFLLLKILDQN